MNSIRIQASINGLYDSGIVSTEIKNALPGNEGKSVKDIEAARDEIHTRLRQAKRELDEQLDVLVDAARASESTTF